MVVKCIIVTLIFGLALAQTEEPLPGITFPPELEEKVDVNLLKNQSLSTFMKKCEENGGPDAFKKAQDAKSEFEKCVSGLVDVKKLEEEVKVASPNGQVDEVFKKYCAKTPNFKSCFSNAMEAMKPCFSPKERENLKTVYNVTEQLAEFVCYKEGDRIALFISEGGKECFQEKQEELQDCANKTFGGIPMLKDGKEFNPDDMPMIGFEEKECTQLSELQQCVVGVLEGCAKPTTGNIVDSLFKFVRKATPCNDQSEVKMKKNAPGSATGLAVASVTVLMGLFTSLLV